MGSGVLNGYIELASSLGLDANALLQSAGLSARSLDDSKSLLSVAAVGRLLELSAERSGAEDFALRLLARHPLSNLGPISLILFEDATPRQTLNNLCRYLRLLGASLITHVQEEGTMVIIRNEILAEAGTPLRQPTELVVGVMFRILCELIGPQRRPVQVCFTHRSPRDTGAHQAFFGSGLLQYNQVFNGLVYRATDLQIRCAKADPYMAGCARDYLDRALARRRQAMSDIVRQLIVSQLRRGRCTLQHLAQNLRVDRRTIHRYLAAEETSFSALLEEVRRALVQLLLRDSDMALREVAESLGFASLSAFGHWFRDSFGCSVTQLRKLGHQ